MRTGSARSQWEDLRVVSRSRFGGSSSSPGIIVSAGDDDFDENRHDCQLSIVIDWLRLKRKLTGGVCVVVGSSLQSPRPVLHSLQSIGSH